MHEHECIYLYAVSCWKCQKWEHMLKNKQLDRVHYGTDGKTDRCGSCYMSLCAICFAAPLVAVRLNYKFVTKSCVFTDHFNQSNFHFCDNTNGLIYFKYIILMP